jgi:hypothetical protein
MTKRPESFNVWYLNLTYRKMLLQMVVKGYISLITAYRHVLHIVNNTIPIRAPKVKIINKLSSGIAIRWKCQVMEEVGGTTESRKKWTQIKTKSTYGRTEKNGEGL